MSKLIVIAMFLIMGGYVSGQTSECKVLMPQISGKYSGDCKKGLANGVGEAQGVDIYRGHFSKGLPNGKGVYTWADGSFYDGDWKYGLKNGDGRLVKKDSVITGIWKDDRYQGKKPEPSFKIISSRNVTRYVFTKSVESDSGVRIKVLLGGRDNSEIEDFSLAYSNGSEYKNVGVYGVQNCSVPYDVTVRYRTWNQLHSVQYDVLFEFTITSPGTWNLTINNM
jgi:hypothetical protein